MATIGSRHKTWNKWTLRRFSKAIVAWWLCQNHRDPLGFPAKDQGPEKEFADLDPFEAEKPGKTQISHVQDGSGLHSIEVKTAANRRQDCVCRCGGRGS
jgi:hypothetical protein